MKKKEFAKLYAQEAKFYYFCKNLDWPKKLTEKYKKFANKIENSIQKIYGVLDTDITFGGITDDERFILYEKIKMDFTTIKCEFSTISCNSSQAEKIKSWLVKNYPNVNIIRCEKNEYLENPWFANWDRAIKYCEENDIEVVLPIQVDNSILKEINEIEENIFILLERKKSLLNKL